MAFPTIIATDFKGIISLSLSAYGEDDFEDYINDTIRKYTNHCLGAKSALQIETLVLKKYNKLLDGYTYIFINKDLEEEYAYFAGFTKFLKSMIYFEIVRNDFQMTEAGAVNNKNENADKVRQYTIAQDRYNKAVDFLNDVFSYMENIGTLSISFDTISEVSGGTYSATVNTTVEPLYEDNEIIQLINPTDVDTTIDATIYNFTWDGTVATFNFDALTGLAFESFDYTPYSDVKTKELIKIYL